MTPVTDDVIVAHALGRTFPGPAPVDAVREASLTVQRGEFVAIRGRSGSGKSTLLNLLALLDGPTTGEYMLSGHRTQALSGGQRNRLRARHVGMVFQSFHLIGHRTVAENVELSLIYDGTPRAQRAGRVSEALARVGLSHRSGFEASVLSGGEQQRVALARALVGTPDVVLADEPTGNLDTDTAEQILALFDAVRANGQTLIVVTHDLEVAGRADRQLHMVDGVLQEDGQ